MANALSSTWRIAITSWSSYGAQEIVGYRALLGVPIILDEELIGAIVVGRDTPGVFADHQIELVNAFADQAAIAISNARLYEAIKRHRAELSRFVSPQVAALLTTKQGKQLLAGHRVFISCLFCDLRGSTSLAETAAPEELLKCCVPITSFRRSGLGSQPRSTSGSWRGAGGDAASTSVSGSESKRVTQRWAGLASKAAMTTVRSDRLRTSRHGSAHMQSAAKRNR